MQPIRRTTFDLSTLKSQFGIRRLRYLFVVNTRKNPVFPLFVMFVLLTIFTAIGMSAYFFGLLDPESLKAEGIAADYDNGFVDTLYWSLKHILDPGAFSEDYSASGAIIAIGFMNTLMGLIIVGGIIGFVINLIQSSMEELRRGGTAVQEFNHIVILGWNRKVVSILRFFEALKQRQPIVILANTDIEMMSEEVRLVERNFKYVRVMPQHGSPTLATELDRVCVQDSRAIIMLADEGAVGNIQSKDIPTIKTLMQLQNLEWSNGVPNTVVEITDQDNVDIADIATKSSVPVVSSSDFVSKTVVQCSRYLGYSAVYAELFSFGNNNIVLNSVKGYENKYFGEVAHAFKNSILLGVSWVEEKNGVERRTAVLNPEPDYELFDDEELIILTSQEGPEISGLPTTEIEPLMDVAPYERPVFNRVLILGWNASIIDILREFDGHAVQEVTVTIVSSHSEEFVERIFSGNMAKGLNQVKVTYKNSDTANRGVLKSLDIPSYDDVIVLADESNPAYDPDSRTSLTLLMIRELKDALAEDEEFPSVTAEFYDQDTRALCVDTPLTDAVISPEFVSMQLTQLARQPILASIYKELLSAGGIEIALRPVNLYVPLDQEISFSELIVATQQVNEIALGIMIGTGGDKLTLNPHNDLRFQFTKDDQVAVLAQQVYT